MFTLSSLAPRFSSHGRGRLLRAIGDFRGSGAHRLAAEELHPAAIAFADRRRLLRVDGLPTGGGGAVIGSLRTAVGSVLDCISGQRCGRATVDAASRSAGSAL